MAFTEEGKFVIKVLRQEHGYGAKRFLKKFLNKGWCLSSVIKLLKGSSMKRSQWSESLAEGKSPTRTIENIELVERLALSQENAPGTHKTARRPCLRSCVHERGGHFEH